MNNKYYVMYTNMLITDIPKEPAVRREWIKYQLRLKGYSLARLSLEYGTCRDSAAQAMNRPVPLWERRIAEKIGCRPQDLWPDRYLEDGRPNRHSPLYPLKGTTRKNRRQRISQQAVLT
jgi:Ner family transcriptional regulator